jgi:hypothetical protein
MRQLTIASIASMLGRELSQSAQFQIGNTSGGHPGQTIQINGITAICQQSIPPGQAIIVNDGQQWIAFAAIANSNNTTRIVQNRRKVNRVIDETPLPFYILIIIDNSGSLTTDQVPGVFEAIDLIRNNLVDLGTLREDQKNEFVPYQSYNDERYLDWFSTRILEVKPDNISRCVVMAWIDEAGPIYYPYFEDGDFFDPTVLWPGYINDVNSFVNFINTQDVDLLGAKIFAPPTQEFYFPEGSFFDHLYLAFKSFTAPPPLDSFRNIYNEQMLEYLPTIDRSQITTAYAYNLMANYLNGFFQKEDFELLPLI